MSPEQIKNLAEQVSRETGMDREDAQRALESNDPNVISLAKQLVGLGTTRDEWHEDMRRHRRKIAASAV